MLNIQRLLMIGLMAASPLAVTSCVAVVAGAAGAGATAAVTADSRTIDNMAHDENIEQEGYKILHSNKILSREDDFSVGIYSMSGNVLLCGQTTNEDYIAWCAQEIGKIDYVRNVYNYVQIKKPISASAVANDSYITSKIKTNLLFASDVRSARFKVVTEDSDVYLMGLVTQDESRRAVNEVLAIEGVRKVYTIFDYLSGQANLEETGYVTTDKIQIERAGSNSSTYVMPANSSQNGGAVIVEEDTDLLAPAY